MRTHKFTALALGLALAMGTVTPTAHAQFATFDLANFVENMMTQLRAVQSNLNETQQLANQIQQYRTMLQNTESLAAGDWSEASQAMGRLAGILDEGRGLAVTGANYEQRFREQFPGYNMQGGYEANYRRWNETSMESVLDAMRVANVQVNGVTSEREAIARLRAAASSSGGQKAALDASNQIALSQVDQLQQLRELMVAQMQAQNIYIAGNTQKDAAQAKSIRDASRYTDPREGWKPKPLEVKK